MNVKYNVDVLECQDIHELPNAWTKDQFRSLLELIEYEDISSINENELKEMTGLALNDLEPEEAAVAVLTLRFGDKLSKGQKQELSEDMQDGKIWEEYGNMAFHEELFNAACMLNWAFEKKFPRPTCTSIKLKVSAANPNSVQALKSPTAAFIARLLNDGMDDNNAIHRLFHDELASDSFPEAEDIIWSFTATAMAEAEKSSEIQLYTSWNWVDELKGISHYESTAHKDD